VWTEEEEEEVVVEVAASNKVPNRYLYNYGDWHVGDAGSSSLCYNPRHELIW
jgi:hypothetical protein